MTVYFLNPKPKTDPSVHPPSPDTIAKADLQGKHMVEWFLTDESLWKEQLGFAALPKIIHTNSPSTDTTNYHFALYGGTKCSKRCYGSVGLVFVDGKPTHKYQGAVYEEGSQDPFAQLPHTTEDGT